MENKIIYDNLDIKTDFVNEWVKTKNISDEYTTHFFIENLPTNFKEQINKNITDNDIIKKVFYNKFKYFFNVKPIYNMNELYISINNSNKKNSDRVFFSKHIDGPFGFFPFCSVYRTLIGCNDNNFIITHFPLKNKDICVSKNDILAFDYNKEIHYISLKENSLQNSSKRTVLKLHYVVYPIGFDIFAIILSYCCEYYNTIARYAFINTLQPKSISSKLLNNIILVVTDNWYYTEKYIGFKYISYFTSFIFIYEIYNYFMLYN